MSRLNKATATRRQIHRWSNSFGRCGRLSAQGCNSSCARGQDRKPEFFRQHLHAHESYFASYGDNFIFRGRSARPTRRQYRTALLLELPYRAGGCVLEHEPFASNAAISAMRDHAVVFGIDNWPGSCRPA